MSEFGALRITLGVVGASGKKELVVAVLTEAITLFVTLTEAEEHVIDAVGGKVMVATILEGLVVALPVVGLITMVAVVVLDCVTVK